jgi:hypothetical protein
MVWAVIATLGSPSAIDLTFCKRSLELQGRGPRAMEVLIAAAETHHPFVQPDKILNAARFPDNCSRRLAFFLSIFPKFF